MARSRRTSHDSSPQLPSALRRNRHGRGARGPITGPELPLLTDRIDLFEQTVASTADYLKGLWPDELAGLHFEVASAPQTALGSDEVERWRVDGAAQVVTLFRVPIERLSKLHRNDELHRRLVVESCVFRAVAEYLGKDPWDLAPDRYRHG